MKFILLDKKEQFEELKKGDFIIVKWSEYWVRHTSKSNEIMAYNIYQNKDSDKEIICQKKDNHFFNYERYLNKTSRALEVYKVI